MVNEKNKTGNNWKKLQRDLKGKDGRIAPKRRQAGCTARSASSSSPSKQGGSAANSGSSLADESHRSKPRISTLSSSLPWFAEDLKKDDLLLLKQQMPTQLTSTATEQDQTTADQQSSKGVFSQVDALSEGKSELGKYVAIDCEMVGVGPNGSESALARVSMVNWHGALIFDSFVKAQERVTDYRTWVSGVRAKDLRDAPTFADVQTKVAEIIKGRILVGHALHNDLSALLLSHPRILMRDTATFAGARALANTKFPSLRKLVSLRLGVEIQKDGTAHSSVEDARATMAVYRTFHDEWQQSLNSGPHRQNKKKSTTQTASDPKRLIIGQGWKKDAAGRTKKETETGPSRSRKVSKGAGDDGEWWRTL